MCNARRFAFIPLLLLVFCSGLFADVVEDGCGFIWKVNNQETEVVEIPNLDILETSKSEESLTFEADAGIEILAVICWRNSVIPANNDYKVVEAGKPLYLKMSDENESRTTILEKSGGSYRLRLIDGNPFSDEERELVVAQIRLFNLSTD